MPTFKVSLRQDITFTTEVEVDANTESEAMELAIETTDLFSADAYSQYGDSMWDINASPVEAESVELIKEDTKFYDPEEDEEDDVPPMPWL